MQQEYINPEVRVYKKYAQELIEVLQEVDGMVDKIVKTICSNPDDRDILINTGVGSNMILFNLIQATLVKVILDHSTLNSPKKGKEMIRLMIKTLNSLNETLNKAEKTTGYDLNEN